jgi:hypothetical protein
VVAASRAFCGYPAGMLVVAIVARLVAGWILNEVMQAIAILFLVCAAAYRVVDGDRQELASVDLDWSTGEWHELEVTARGTSIAIAWDGEVKLEAEDATFARGKLGLWTKADSVSRFDDLEATAD